MGRSLIARNPILSKLASDDEGGYRCMILWGLCIGFNTAVHKIASDKWRFASLMAVSMLSQCKEQVIA